MKEFISKDIYEIKGRKHFSVFCDQEYSSDKFKGLLGEKVLIDNKIYKVCGVERFCHMPPFVKGEAIGLLVEC